MNWPGLVCAKTLAPNLSSVNGKLLLVEPESSDDYLAYHQTNYLKRLSFRICVLAASGTMWMLCLLIPDG